MKTYTLQVAGEPVSIHFPEYPDEVGPGSDFQRFLNDCEEVVAVDTEATGLDIWKQDWKLRLVQFGHRNESWVLDADRFAAAITDALYYGPHSIICHNAQFDLLAIDRAGLGDLERLVSRVIDSRLLAHLLDPRGPQEGGIGHGLKELARAYVDRNAPDGADELKAVFRKEYKATIAKGWSVIDVAHPTYVTYAGLDTILTRRLFDVLAGLVRQHGFQKLSKYEHHIQRITMGMVRRGMLVDVDYTEQLVLEFAYEAEEAIKQAAEYGCTNVDSPRQVAAALVDTGWKPREFTNTGQPKVDQAVLSRLEADGNPLAIAVRKAKRAEKWSTAYAQAMLELRDENNRVHPLLDSLKARTGRMAISRPPLHQLPARDEDQPWRIRRSLLAEPGHKIVSVDYNAIELCLLAAFADVPGMKAAVKAGIDLHAFAAEAVFGKDFTPHERRIAKGIGFGRVYGGGAAGISRLTGTSTASVRAALTAYDQAFPEIRAFSKQLERKALTDNWGEIGLSGAQPYVVTPKGRRLPVEEHKLYCATNYLIQGHARDILADALIRLDDAGLTPYLRLLVHDECLASVPANMADDLAREIAREMATTFEGVPLTTDAKIGGRSWGSLYAAPDDQPLKEAA